MSQHTNPDRRRFLGTAAVTLAAAPFAMSARHSEIAPMITRLRYNDCTRWIDS